MTLMPGGTQSTLNGEINCLPLRASSPEPQAKP